MLTSADGSHWASKEASTAQKVVIINGSIEVLDVLETMLAAGHYDMVFVENYEHAYSQIKRVQPNLVILCMQAEDLYGFQILTMLKLDPETKGIPVLTYTTEYEGKEPVDDPEEITEVELFTAKPEFMLN